jgi:hypothetical protein
VIGDLAANNATALATVPGVTAEIIGAGVGGLFEAYSLGFRFVWVAAGCFTVIAAFCKSTMTSSSLVAGSLNCETVASIYACES